MDVVVRTPHGDADIEIVSAPGTTTLGDLLATVTGQAPPAVARVDRRVISTSRRLDDLGLKVGSVVDARPAETAPVMEATDSINVDLLQLTGRGAGTICSLPVGRYRVGAGRRLNADELAEAPVETPAFEIDVDDDGSVQVTPGPRIGGPSGLLTPTLNGQLFDRTLDWTHGRLSVGGRVFELSNSPLVSDDEKRSEPDERGTVPFQRSPSTATIPSVVAVGARQRALAPSRGLWSRRRNSAHAYEFSYGLMPDGEHDATVDFSRHSGLAIVGSDRFTTALARTILVEASTVHGPSDLRVVVAATPERLGQWDWAKWLPHTRGGDPTSRPQLFSESDQLREWATRLGHGASAPNDDPDTVPTLLVLDGPALWAQRDSPLHAALIDPPSHLRVIVLCGGSHQAPAMCSVVVEEDMPSDLADDARDTREGATLVGSLATLTLPRQRPAETINGIRPALVMPALALEVALAIAAFDDLDVIRPTVVPTVLAPPSIAELIDLQVAVSSDRDGLSVTLGLIDDPGTDGIGAPPKPRRPVRVDLSSARITLLSAEDREAHDNIVASVILSAAATRRTDQLAILTVGSHRPDWHSEVPHLAGHIDRSTPDDPARLVHRVAHVLTSQPGLEVLVVIENAFASAVPMETGHSAVPIELTAGMLELAESLSRVHVVMTTDRPIESVSDATRRRCGVEITLDGTPDHPHGQVVSDHTVVPFLGPTRVSQAGEPTRGVIDEREHRLVVGPCVHGRSMTPLERRVARINTHAADHAGQDREAQQIAQRIADDAGTDAGPAFENLLPPPLVTSIDHLTLLADHAGDAVPIGLLDRPEHAVSEAYWWRPGPTGSLLAVGSPRSGMGDLTDLITLGIAARFSTDELRVYAIEPLPQRRRAFDALPHCVDVVSTDEPMESHRVASTVSQLLGTRRSRGRSAGDPDILLSIGDLGRLRRWLPETEVAPLLELLATIGADGPALGINLICVATRVDDLGPLVRLAGDRLVGTVSEASDRTRLGVPAPGPADRHTGRCWSVNADRRVQLATPPDSVELELARLAPEPVRSRPGRGVDDRMPS